MLRRALRQVLMRHVDDPEVVDALLRHASFRDRAVLEKALSGCFFAPFVHQEMVGGERFEVRARFSRAALGNMALERVREAGLRACDREIREGAFDSLLDEVRRTVTRASVQLALGSDALLPLARDAVRDIDRSIKMVARAHLPIRSALAAALRRVLASPADWPAESYVGVAREEAMALTLDERVDHVAAVFLATGTIQVSDTVTHALIALAQHPKARAAGDEAVVLETLRCYPVNASITRQPSAAVQIGPHSFPEGEPVTVVPADLGNRVGFDPLASRPASWSFGAGPRACPARKLSLALAATVLGAYRALGVEIEPGYLHRRSLAFDVRAVVGPGGPPRAATATERLSRWARYATVSAESYPRAFLRGLPELVRVVAS